MVISQNSETMAVPAGVLPSFIQFARETVLPFDAIFIGIAAVGLSLETLCAYLGLTRHNAFEHIVRLGLPTPADTPLRKASKSGWTVDDIQRLIAWRSIGVHPDVIGQQLSRPRSPNAVRSKSRRIGLTAPPRKTLFRPTPEQLLLPFGWSDQVCREPEHQKSRSLGTRLKCPSFQTTLSLDPRPLPTTIESVDFQDLTWVGLLRGRRGRPGAASDGISTNQVAVFAIGIVACAAVDRHRAAELLGLTVGAYRTQRTRLGIPRIAGRAAFTDVFDVEVGRATIKRSNLEMVPSIRRTDGQPPQFFWRNRNERHVRLSPSERPQRKRGEPTYSNPITIVTRAVLDAEARIAPQASPMRQSIQILSSRPAQSVPSSQSFQIPSAPFATPRASL